MPRKRIVAKALWIVTICGIGVGWMMLREQPVAKIAGAVVAVENVPSPQKNVEPKTPTDPALEAFSQWSEEYHATDSKLPDEKLAEGVRLATERRLVLAKMIRSDPERALAAAVPMVARAQMPPQILALLEERISGRGDVDLIGVTPAPGQVVEEGTYRIARIAGRAMKTYTYGRRAKMSTLRDVGIHGISIDEVLAMDTSPVRVLEPGEMANGREIIAVCPISNIKTPIEVSGPLNVKTPVAVDAGGIVYTLCKSSHVALFTKDLIHKEMIAADAGQGSSGYSGKPSIQNTHGTKKVLIIRIDFSDLQGVPFIPFSNIPISEDYAVNLFNSPNGVRDYFTANSYGKTLVSVAPTVAGDSPDVTGIIRMPRTAQFYATTLDPFIMHNEARAGATAAGFNVAGYDRIGVVFSNLSGLPGSRVDYGGAGLVAGPWFWVNGYYDFRVLAHEIGHSYGLYHSNLWQVSDGNPASTTGTSTEYGDIFCIMGGAYPPEYHFSHWNKSMLHWLPDDSVKTITTAGTYRVHRFDSQNALFTTNLALKIVRNSTQDYWIGYRGGLNSTNLASAAYVLLGYNDNRPGDLVDFNTPGTNPWDAGLQVGQSFTDLSAGVRLETIGSGGTGDNRWLDMNVTFLPRLQFANANVSIDEQNGTATLTVTRTNDATSVASVSYNTANGTAVAPADFTATSGTLTWTSGDVTPKTITIPIAADSIAEGVERFTVTLSGASGAMLAEPSTTTVTIVDPGLKDPQFAGEFINNRTEKVVALPDGGIIAAGWFSELQNQAGMNFTRRGIARFNANGTIDPNFAIGGGVAGGGFPRIYDVSRQADGKLVIGGGFTLVDGLSRNNIARLNEDGSLDHSFNPGSGANGLVNAVTALPNGKIIVGGSFSTFDGQAKRLLVQLNADGSVDSTFTPPTFTAASDSTVESIAVQGDGNFVVGGRFATSVTAPFKSGICRVTNTGNLDPTFTGVTQGAHTAGNPGSRGTVTEIKILSDETMFVAGNFTAFNNTSRGRIAKLTSNGELAADFAPVCNNTIWAILPQPDGKLLVGGEFSTINGDPANSLARLLANGMTDSGFQVGATSAMPVWDLALQANGQVVFGSDVASFQGSAGVSSLWRIVPGLPGLPGVIEMAANTHSGVEGLGLTVALTRTGGSLGAIEVAYSTVSGTATSSLDFTPSRGVATWLDGDTATKTINIPITGDSIADSGETFLVNLGEGLNGAAVLGAKQRTFVTIATGYEDWRTRNFTTAELANAEVSGDYADPDGDDLSNLLEYALNSAPKVPDVGKAPTVGTTELAGGEYLNLTFRRRVPQLDLTYTVQNSDTLFGSWPTTTLPVGTPIANGDGTETVTMRDDTLMSAAEIRFIRLNVKRTP